MSAPGLSLLREALVSSNLVSESDWENAVKVAHIRKISLERVFVEMGIFEAKKIGQITEILYGIPRIDVEPQGIDPACLALIPKDVAQRYKSLPLYVSGDASLTVGMVDPLDVDSVDRLKYLIKQDLRVVWISEDDFKRGFHLYDQSSGRSSVERILEDFHGKEADVIETDAAPKQDDEELLRLMAEDAPVVRLAGIIFAQAIKARASDIHLEAGRNEARVRIRVDGCLTHLMALPMAIYPALISRIKLVAHLDIAERRMPQDGRSEVRLEGRTIDMRVATTPALHGEKIVIRIIDAGSKLQKLPDLGYSQHNLERIHKLLARPYGMILVTGPTGSGKSTTLYTALEILNTLERNVQTIEDPVERQMEGISQVQIHPHIGLSFARVLRSYLRQDPDVIMVGEIRDAETAEIAIQAALTGHLVLSSLHTNDAVSTVTRLIDMGVPAYKVAAALKGVLAQRLVRRLCGECSQRVPITADEERGLLDLPGQISEVYRPVGCAACGNTGYRGRTVVSEVLSVTTELARAVALGSDNTTLTELAVEQGLVPMRQDAIQKAATGLTSVVEAMRVTMSME